MTNMCNLNSFYNGKRVLLTGHTGFKGSWLSIWLQKLGAEVFGYALDPVTPKDNFVLTGLAGRMTDIRGDLLDRAALHRAFEVAKPDLVFHLAAQPLVRLSYELPVETWAVNVMGSIHVMEEFRRSDTAKAAVMITTDKCYENKETLTGYKETDPMGGYDPYSSSKGACEIAISSWRRSFLNPSDYAKHGKAIASARAGNVIGGGDWAKDRIIPDCIRALEAKQPIIVRNPGAVRPWQHVLEPLRGYLMLGQALYRDPVKFAEGWNFGPEHDSVLTVREVVELLISEFGYGEMTSLAQDTPQPHEANLLTLDITKAQHVLGWSPRLNAKGCLHLTAEWYKKYQSMSAYDLCFEQISEFEEKII